MGYSSKILSNATSSLLAQQAVIATTSNNISNVNTPGYARRAVNLETRAGALQGIAVGNGVQIGDVTRVVDDFINKMLFEAEGDKASAEIQNQFLDRAQALFALNESTVTIGSAYTEFVTAVNDLAGNPASIELRTNLIERGRDIVNAISTTYQGIADLQHEADDRIATELDTVNTYASQIAALNGAIRTRESSGGTAADERDQRDILLQKLAQKISFNTIEDSDGQANIFLDKGFALVTGDVARRLEFTSTPSFSSGTLPPSLGGSVLRHVVFDYNSTSGTEHIDLTQALKNGGGSIGGLLKLRGYNSPAATSAFSADGSLVGIASRVEAFARNLLTSVNRTYLGPSDENGGVAGFQPTSGDLNGNSPAVFGLFDFTYSGVKDANGNGTPDLSDLTSSGIDHFSTLISFAPSDPKTIAAAVDANAAAGSTAFPQGDNQNLLALAATLNSTSTVFATGSYSFTGSYEGAYQEAISQVGILKQRADSDEKVSSSNLVTMQGRRDSISAVSLDEEFTSLIKFQKAFQASARMIKIADDLLSQIVQLI